MHFLTASNYEHENLKYFIASAKKNNIDVKILGMGVTTKYRKFIMEERFRFLLGELNKLPDEEIILFTDAWDVLYLSNEEEILKAFKSFDCKILFNAEKWDTHHGTENIVEFTRIKKADSPYWSLNGGCIIGYNKEIKKMVEALLVKRKEDNTFNDQNFFGIYFTKNQDIVTIDYYCKIFWCMVADDTKNLPILNGRYYNANTNNYPLIMHHPLEKDNIHVFAKELGIIGA